MFRGDYVTLNYEISELDLKTIPHGKENFKPNDTVYVVLKKDGKYQSAVSVSHKRPDDGIDSYYVPEGRGRVIENARVQADVEVSVDRWGNSALSRLFLAGKEVKFE